MDDAKVATKPRQAEAEDGGAATGGGAPRLLRSRRDRRARRGSAWSRRCGARRTSRPSESLAAARGAGDAAKPVQVTVKAHNEPNGAAPSSRRDADIDPAGADARRVSVLTKTDELVGGLVRAEELSSVLITGSAVMLLMLFTAFVVNRVVGRPVSLLEAAMKRVEGGMLDARVPVATHDEVGALSRGFNAMLGGWRRRTREIRAFNRRLADEVKAATIDLARKNEALAQLNKLLRETRQELGDKERLAALGQLAAQLAHEIGTPLGSVSGHLQLALSGRDVPQALKDRLQVATRELERVSKIVRDYLDSTRTVAPERVTVDVERVVDEALGICISAEARARIEVVRSRSTARRRTPRPIRACCGRSWSTSSPTPSTPCRAQGGHIRVEAAAQGGAVAIAVADDGVGIAPEDVARIFEPFYTTKGRGKGTGLGLAICRELATALGGRITVDSAPGRGSTFTVTLPRSERKAA